MSNITPIREVDIPCKITLNADTEYAHTYYRTDPTKRDGWEGCNPLGIHFTKKECKRIKKTLQRQGWYTKIVDMDYGDDYIIKVVPCAKEDWYKSEEK